MTRFVSEFTINISEEDINSSDYEQNPRKRGKKGKSKKTSKKSSKVKKNFSLKICNFCDFKK
jgi:hypothetical protein